MLNVIKKRLRPEKGQVLVFSILLLPLVLGIVFLIIEVGNLYVYYSELQHVADITALTGNTLDAKKIFDKNNTINMNADRPLEITPYYIEYTDDDDNEYFLIKLKKDVKPLIKFFDMQPITLEAYAAVLTDSDSKKLVPFPINPKSPKDSEGNPLPWEDL